MSTLLARLLFIISVVSFQRATFLNRKLGGYRLSQSSSHCCGAQSFKLPTMKATADAESNETINEDPTSLNATDPVNKPPQKRHTLTICMVPPPSATGVWRDVTIARTKLKDPGLFRWPPHANLLYPFIEIKDNFEGITQQLRNATSECAPFQVSLDSLGTFGGKNRGVLWLYPKSYRSDDRNRNEVNEEPMIQLQAMLEQEFPTCTDQRKNGMFSPHMTISHFASLEDAEEAQAQIESWWPSNLTFDVNEIYLLQRKGDDGQFLRVATISLGSDVGADDSSGIQNHDPPVAFPSMPALEEDWVKEERMKMKERRNNSWKGRRRTRGGRRRRSSSGDSRRGPSRKTDTPEEIAAKRAARKEKRERLERERLEKEDNSNDG